MSGRIGRTGAPLRHENTSRRAALAAPWSKLRGKARLEVFPSAWTAACLPARQRWGGACWSAPRRSCQPRPSCGPALFETGRRAGASTVSLLRSGLPRCYSHCCEVRSRPRLSALLAVSYTHLRAHETSAHL
eukprot:15459607-Alexandrium_andersonii.AAC.1